MAIQPKTLGLVMPLIYEYEKGPSGSFAATAYIDLAANWTIGWGHKLTVNDPLLHATISAQQAQDLLDADLDRQNTYLDACLGSVIWNALAPNEQGALIDFVFNLGIGNFERSTMHHYIATGRLDMVPDEFGRWIMAAGKPQQGLIRRRAAEKALWEQDIA